jgi:long-chain acyl-CoA synthetase
MLAIMRFSEWFLVSLQGLVVTLLNALSSLTQPRWLPMRLAVIFDRKLNPATVLEYGARWHGNKPILYPDVPLGFSTVPREGIGVADLLRLANRIGNALRNKAKLEKYDRVAVWMTSSPNYFLVASGVIRAGGIAVPINGGMQLDALRYYLKHTGSKILVTDAATLKRHNVSRRDLDMVDSVVSIGAAPDFDGDLLDLTLLEAEESSALTAPSLPDDADVLLVHTSGTTGFPKATIMTSSSLISAIRSDAKRHALTPNNRVLNVAPFNHAYTHILMMISVLGGIPLYNMSEADGELALRRIAEHRITVFSGFAVMYLKMFLAGLEGRRLDTVRAWVSVADAAHEVHMRAFTQHGAYLRLFGMRLVSSIFLDGLGSSEVGTAATRRYVHAKTSAFGRNIGRREMFGPETKCADEHGRRVPPGTIARLYTRGPTLFKGYWNAHDKLHGTVINGWWWTGDVVYQDWSGSYYHLDREVDTIVTAAGPVYTLSVEEVAMNHPSVGEATCFAVNSADGHGVQAVLAVYPRPGSELDAEACLGWVNERVRVGQRPSKVIIVTPEQLPLGLTGKMLKRSLRARYRDCLSDGKLRDDPLAEFPAEARPVRRPPAAQSEPTALTPAVSDAMT